ncbi:MAG: hypothetical protein OIF54_05785, partial [Cohaesibacter sp.]|nr:hypothetical protein [Cohaesibacter sp.]
MSRPADLLPQKFAPYHQRHMETQKFITKHKSKARQIGLALSSNFEIHIHYMLIKDSPICAEQQVMDLMNSLGSQSFLNWKLLIYTQQFPSFVHDPAWLSEDGRLVFLSQENGLYDHPARPLSEDGAVFDLYISRSGYLAEEALLEMVSIYSQHRDNGHELDLLYWEEDYHVSPDSKKTLPLYKPAWDTHRLYCDNFIKGAFFVRRRPALELACLSDP